EVGVRLHGVADEVVHAGEPRVELAVRLLDHRARVDVAGRAEAARDLRELHAVERELAGDADEPAHGEAGFAGGASGTLSGPFCPQAGKAATQASARAARRARIIERIMTESEFHGAVDAILARIESSLEGEEALEVDLESSILTITCEDGSKVIVNRQTPNREIWVAARSGGFHFTFRDGAWGDTRGGEELFASLSRVRGWQAGVQARWK